MYRIIDVKAVNGKSPEGGGFGSLKLEKVDFKLFRLSFETNNVDDLGSFKQLDLFPTE
jgi:hypothetical protein